MSAVSIRGVTKRFGAYAALKGIDLEVELGAFLVLLGPSGCGKSTLLNLVAGLDSISSGEIAIDAEVVNEVHPKDRDVAMVFQSYALYPSMSVRRNITFALEMRGASRAERDAAAQKAAEMLHITHLLDRRPSQLSGGQRQRVAMGRALVREPKVFLFDEPLSNLDAQLRTDMRTEIRRLHARLGTTVIYVTHDQIEAMTMATCIAVMKDGEIVQSGSPSEIYERPETLFVARFVGAPPMNFLRGRLRRERERLVVEIAAARDAETGCTHPPAHERGAGGFCRPGYHRRPPPRGHRGAGDRKRRRLALDAVGRCGNRRADGAGRTRAVQRRRRRSDGASARPPAPPARAPHEFFGRCRARASVRPRERKADSDRRRGRCGGRGPQRGLEHEPRMTTPIPIRAEVATPGVLLIRIERPEKRNALTNAMVIEIGALLRSAACDKAVRAVTLAGGDAAFSAGADIAEIRARGAQAVNDPLRVAAWREIERFPKPLIAAVEGVCFGAGNELAMTCDIIVAGAGARFGQPEVKIGGLPGDGGTQRLARRVGQGFASMMIMTGDPVDAETALRVGLASVVCEGGRALARALEIATAIASRAPLAVQEAKACIRVAVGATAENGLAFEREALWRLIESRDSREGALAFLEKRAPEFTGEW